MKMLRGMSDSANQTPRKGMTHANCKLLQLPRK
jgi:hypothetical protein